MSTTAPALPPSYQQLLSALAVGDSHCFAKKLDQDSTSRDDIQDAERKLVNVVRSQMARAHTSTGFKYTADLVSARAPSTRDPIVIYIVTRTE